MGIFPEGHRPEGYMYMPITSKHQWVVYIYQLAVAYIDYVEFK